MVTGANADQGWRWGEVDEAITNLPEGPLRARQRMHFDALTLLAVFIQHGDRKANNSDWSAAARSIGARATHIHSRDTTARHLYSSSALMARRATSR